VLHLQDCVTYTYIKLSNLVQTQVTRPDGLHHRLTYPSAFNIVTYKPTARQRLGRHIPAGANTRNSRTSTATQRTSKHASLTIDAVLSAWSVQSGYKEVFVSVEQYRTESSFETPACQDMGLGAEELN
jgi:hypothetical protein